MTEDYYIARIEWYRRLRELGEEFFRTYLDCLDDAEYISTQMYDLARNAGKAYYLAQGTQNEPLIILTAYLFRKLASIGNYPYYPEEILDYPIVPEIADCMNLDCCPCPSCLDQGCPLKECDKSE